MRAGSRRVESTLSSISRTGWRLEVSIKNDAWHGIGITNEDGEKRGWRRENTRMKIVFARNLARGNEQRYFRGEDRIFPRPLFPAEISANKELGAERAFKGCDAKMQRKNASFQTEREREREREREKEKMKEKTRRRGEWRGYANSILKKWIYRYAVGSGI